MKKHWVPQAHLDCDFEAHRKAETAVAEHKVTVLSKKPVEFVVDMKVETAVHTMVAICVQAASDIPGLVAFAEKAVQWDFVARLAEPALGWMVGGMPEGLGVDYLFVLYSV